MRFMHCFYHDNALAALMREAQVGAWRSPAMKLYFSPLACSLATRIALYEAKADASFEEVDSKTKRTLGGRDFRQLHPLGLVPVLELPSGELLSENAAVLQYVARACPEAQLAPTSGFAVAQLQQWLCFIGTELHKGVFMPLLGYASEAEREAAKGRVAKPFDYLSRHLEGRDFLEGGFTVADAYLLTILNWCEYAGVALADWPALKAYRARLRARPAIVRAMAEEYPLLRAA
jgi:glutathione S-transferase